MNWARTVDGDPSIMATTHTGRVRTYTFTEDGWRNVVVLTPLGVPLMGGEPDTHALVTLFCQDYLGDKGRSYVLALQGFLSRRYFEEKYGPFVHPRCADAAYHAVADALERSHD